MDLAAAMRVSASGMKVQSERLRVTSENLANADSTAPDPSADPYRRKTVTFENHLDKETGAAIVDVRREGTDKSDFIMKYEPGHPAADASGYVKYPNVNPFIELMDMREAQRTYEANLNALELAKSLQQRTLDLLR